MVGFEWDGGPKAILDDGAGITGGVANLTDQMVGPGIQLGGVVQGCRLARSLDSHLFLFE